MKAINKFFYALLAFVAVGMVSCTQEATHEPGAPELEGCYAIYFPDANTYANQGPMGDLSLDPSEPTSFTYVAFRENTDGEVTVPVEITENTTDADGNPMFTVSDIVFGDGEDVAQFNVTLSANAEVGVPYTLTLSVKNDPKFVKQYDATSVPSLSVTVNRVKWISLGKCMFTEDLLTSWWNFGFDPVHPTYTVEVQVRADSIDQAAFDAAIAGTGDDSGLSGIYRIVNGWRVGPWGDEADPEWMDYINADPVYTLIYANPYDKVSIPLQEIGISINGGMASIYSYPEALKDLGRDDEVVDEMYGCIKNGALTLPLEDGLLGCPGGSYVGSNYYGANSDGAFKLVLSPALGSYELVMPDAETDGDFSFREVELSDEAMFYSESQAASWTPVLEQGRCEVSTKDADRIFHAEYGVLYRLPDLYAVGYPIYFAVKDGVITLPLDYLAQNTGLVQSGYEVMMAIDTEASTFDATTGELALAAEFFVGAGDDAVSYGVFAELISTEAPEFPVTPMLDLKNDFSYTEFFSATLSSAFLKDKIAATIEQGTCLVDPELPVTAYRMPDLYTAGYDIYFVADQEGSVDVTAGYELQATGVNIYGEPAYMQIVGGTCTEEGVTLQARFVNSEGTALVPGICKETMSNYVWVDVATGSWDCNVLQNPIAGLTLQNAQGTNLYRVVDFMASVTGVEGNHFVFTWDKTSNLCEVQGLIDTGIPASALGVSGVSENVHFADEKTTWNSVGYDDTWESLYAEYGASVQPYYSAEYNAFVFRVSYFMPEAGKALTFTTSNGGKTNFVNEIFYLDGEVSEGPQWVDVATGSYYSVLFTDADNYYVPFTNRKLQNLENTNEFRIVNFTDAGTDFNFTWDTTTHKVDVVGLNDTGVDSAPMGGKGNIFACDLKTFYQTMGYDYTWDQITAGEGEDFQSYFDAQNGEFVFNLVLAAPEMGPGVALGGGTIFTDYFVPDSPAAAASTSSANATIKKATSIKGATVKKHNLAKNSTTSSAYKAINLGVAKMSKEAKAVRSLKTVTPVKRGAKVKQAIL